MDQTTLQIIAGLAIPSAAIIISTLVAVTLAKSERLAATAARAEERAQMAADRLDDRSDDAFVRALMALATLNTINLRAESVAEPFRDLRIGLTLLEAASPQVDNDLLGEWFEAERLAGMAQAGRSMESLALLPARPSNDDEVEAIVAAGAPLNIWARDFANNLRHWRQKGASRSDLVTLAENAKTLH